MCGSGEASWRSRLECLGGLLLGPVMSMPEDVTPVCGDVVMGSSFSNELLQRDGRRWSLV